MTDSPRRQPQMFDPDDPRLRSASVEAATFDHPGADDPDTLDPPPKPPALRMPTAEDLQRGVSWGFWLAGSALSLLILSFALRFWTFVWDLFLRNDWIGWVAVVLAAILLLSLTVLLGREVVGVLRLAKVQRLRKCAELSLDPVNGSSKRRAEQLAVAVDVRALYAGRPELAWSRARLAGHDKTIMSGTERLALLDRELLAVVDDQAKAAIAQSARRVAVVTAITPFAIFDMGFVLYENLRMLRRIATIYGGRPGYAALLRLASRVVAYVVASGGLALTDDLLGQFIGQGLAKRLSARAGQGMFNGGLTVRLGIAAIDLTRPLPFIEAKRPRFRDLALEVSRGLTGAKTPESSAV